MEKRGVQSTPTKPKGMPGAPALFRGKLRKPVTVTLIPAHHRKVEAATNRLGLTRADLIGLLIEKYADRVTF